MESLAKLRNLKSSPRKARLVVDTIRGQEVEKALKLRDLSDKNRKESPLLFVKGAVLVDTTNLSIKQMEAKLTKLLNKVIKNNNYGNL